MDLESLQLIREVLPKGRTLYYDFPNRYAVILLKKFLGSGGKNISEIKASKLAPLLEKECVKGVISEVGRNWLAADDLSLAWPKNISAYRLTLGTWPDEDERPNRGWYQVTRWGWSLVLRLNLVREHKQELASDVPYWKDYNDFSFHPVETGEELTLAWSRIDLDFEAGEALIEEIQSDWVRDVNEYAQQQDQSSNEWQKYYDLTLKPMARTWPETMLSATLWFIFEELSIERVFYHTHESGAVLKRIQADKPPRSIYSDLPRKFCFRVTHNGPKFVRDSKNRELSRVFASPDTRWYIMTLPIRWKQI